MHQFVVMANLILLFALVTNNALAAPKTKCTWTDEPGVLWYCSAAGGKAYIVRDANCMTKEKVKKGYWKQEFERVQFFCPENKAATPRQCQHAVDETLDICKSEYESTFESDDASSTDRLGDL